LENLDRHFESGRERARARPAIYLSDSLSRDAKIRTLEETVRLETRAKTLNPKWYEGMLKHGHRGVAEIENHLSNTFGWSATADAVDDWVYAEVAKTFLLDEAMLERLRTLNPHSAHSLVNRLLKLTAAATGMLIPRCLRNCVRSLRTWKTSSKESPELNATVFYIGSSLLAPLRTAECEINRELGLDLTIKAFNFGASLTEDEWSSVDQDLSVADVVFVIHVMDGENAARLLLTLEQYKQRHRAVIVINCMPDLMRRTRMGKLDFAKFGRPTNQKVSRRVTSAGLPGRGDGQVAEGQSKSEADRAGGSRRLLGTVSSWIGEQVRLRGAKNGHSHTRYLKLVDRLPGLLRFVPGAGALRDVKNYLSLFCYFLQPTPRISRR